MQAKLVIIAGSTKPQEIRLKLPAILGRGRACSIQLPQPLVSRQHCEIFADGEQLRVRDLGSLNGTLVNNERITECELTDGQLLTVGSITFRVAIDVAATTGKPSGSSINKGPAPATTTPALDNAVDATTNFVPPNEFTERAIEPIRTEPETLIAPPDAPSTANPPNSPSSNAPSSGAPSPVTPPSASESNVRADDLLPPSIAADFMPPAAIPPVAIPPAIAPPAAIAPIAGPFPAPPIPIPAVPPMAMPVAMPMAAPLASPLPPGAAPPATPPNVFSAPPPTSPPDQAPPAADADDADLQAFLKSLGKKK